MYQVLARTWRPQNFAELVGQEQVARTLSNAIEAERLAHAYIFAGLRGTGKTTVARILAKCLNCEKGPTAQPCGECAACSEIAESRSIDVLELDAASRTGVGDIRELQEVISYAPVRDRYKVLIIDEAHMLSKAAFNALLKTLEEPPPNVVFMLATTELQKILPTILSRCQVFEFRRVTAVEMVKHMRKICAQEKIEISDHALDRIARAGEGSVRDSLSVLERVVAFCGKTVADEDVLRVLGAVNARIITEMIEGLATRDAARMLDVLDGLIDEGHDLIHFWNQLISALRDLLVVDALPDRRELLSRSADEAESLIQAAGALGREDLIRSFQILADLEPGLKASSKPRYLFEATLIRLAGLGVVQPIEQVLRSLEGGLPQSPAVPASPTRRSPVQKKNVETRDTPVPVAPPADPRQLPVQGGRLAELSAAVGRERPMLGAMLGQVTEIEEHADRVVLRLPEDKRIVQRQLEQRESMKLIESCAAEFVGRPVEVSIELGGSSTVAPASAAAAAPDPAPTPTPTPRPQKSDPPDRTKGPETTAPRAEAEVPASKVQPSERQALLEAAQREPGVRRLLDTFGAQVVDVRPHESTRNKEESR